LKSGGLFPLDNPGVIPNGSSAVTLDVISVSRPVAGADERCAHPANHTGYNVHLLAGRGALHLLGDGT